MRFRSQFVVAQHFFVFQAAEKFQFAELLGLEAAGGRQLFAKSEEMRGQHGFEDRELLDQHAHDFRAATQQARGFVDSIARSRIGRGIAQIGNHRVQIVQQLLEPQFVGLVNDDEQQFVMMRRRRFRMLQLQ